MLIAATVEMGKIEELGGCCVATRFRVLNGVPLFAQGSVLVVNDGRSIQRFPVPPVRASILAGYGRVWLPLLAGVSFLIALVAFVPLLAVTVLLVLASVYLWAWYGKLSASERRLRLAYATWVRATVDVGEIPADVELPFEEGLRAYVDDRASSAPETYRKRLGAEARWRVAALESSDPETLMAALTRARAERRKVEGEARAELDAFHEKIWQKLEPLLVAGKTSPVFEEWSRHIADTEGRADRSRRQAVRALGVAAAVGIPTAIAAGWFMLPPKLHVVNATGRDGLTVLLDGKPVAQAIPTIRREDDGAFVTVRLRGGQHELVTRNAAGDEIDRRRFDVAFAWGPAALFDDQPGRLYAPGRSADVCFVEEIVTYSATQSLRDYEAVRLDMTDSLHLFGERIDHWFQEAPEEIEVSQGTVTTQQRTVRAAPCGALKKR